MGRTPTVQDVAERAGVSRQTVSNVLNSPDIVRPETRERVQAAIDDLGYRRHAAARQLRTQRSSTIGVHLDPYRGGVSGVVLDRFVHALTERSNDRGMRMLVYAARSTDEEIARLRELSDGGEIDAAVLSGTFAGDPRTDWLAARHIPFVSFGRPWTETTDHLWVDVDGAAGTGQATRHALTFGSRVAFLGWPEGSETGDDRARGWREALTGAGVTAPRWSSQEDVAAARAAVRTGLADGAVDAIVCASDSLAIGAALGAADAGSRSLPIIGFDNTPAVEALGLSSVEQRPEEVATAVLDLLMGVDGRAIRTTVPTAEARSRLIVPELVVRTRG